MKTILFYSIFSIMIIPRLSSKYYQTISFLEKICAIKMIRLVLS